MSLSWNRPRSVDALYEAFEHVIMLVLTLAIILLVLLATFHLLIGIGHLILTDSIDPSNPAVFQNVFGMFFTVVIGLEFKHSLVVSSSQGSVVRARSIILIGMLATVRKFIVLDLAKVDAPELLSVASAVLALGVVYWLVRDQDRRTRLRNERVAS